MPGRRDDGSSFLGFDGLVREIFARVAPLADHPNWVSPPAEAHLSVGDRRQERPNPYLSVADRRR